MIANVKKGLPLAVLAVYNPYTGRYAYGYRSY
jgi:hypothetical protein